VRAPPPVTFASCDAWRRAPLEALWSNSATHPPTAVVHAAGVLDDGDARGDERRAHRPRLWTASRCGVAPFTTDEGL